MALAARTPETTERAFRVIAKSYVSNDRPAVPWHRIQVAPALGARIEGLDLEAGGLGFNPVITLVVMDLDGRVLGIIHDDDAEGDGDGEVEERCDGVCEELF